MSYRRDHEFTEKNLYLRSYIHGKIKLVFLSLFVLSSFAQAQKLEKQLRSLENDFKSFKYQQVINKGDFLLADPYTSKSDSLQIFQYMLSSAYALSDTVLAKQIIVKILHTEPSFALNPKEISPKIIEFFNYVKKTLSVPQSPQNESTPSRSIATLPQALNPVKPLSFVASALLPGSGHLLSDFRPQGYERTAVSAALLVAALTLTMKTEQTHNDYLSAAKNADFDELFNRYNRYYKIRNTLWIGYGLWSLYNLFDLQRSSTLQMTVNGNRQKVALRLTKHF